jgi:hypothetical protein
LAKISAYTGACLLNSTTEVDSKVMISTKCRAMQALNKMLAAQVGCPSDEIIAGVLLLVSTDICQDEIQHLRMHLEGLKEMLRLRGGLSVLGMHGLLAKLAIV